MWQHDIISDLSRTTIFIDGKRYKFEIGGGHAYRNVRENLPILKKGLPSATCFYMGTLDLAEKFMDQFEKTPEQMKLNYDYENIHFPYPQTLWEYSIPEGGRNGAKSEAIFVVDFSDIIFVWPLILTPKMNVWLPAMYFFRLSKSKDAQLQIIGPSDMTNEEKEDLKSTAQRVASYVLSFLKILSCKNVTQEVIAIRQTRQERRHDNKPLYSYRVLNVNPLGAYRHSNSIGESDNHNRVHFCRGHFKQFYPTKPLFGKFTGLYWWEPHLRGQDKSGFIDKDYEVEAAQK